MRRIITVLIALTAAAALLLAGTYCKKQRTVSYEGAVMVMTDRVEEACHVEE